MYNTIMKLIKYILKLLFNIIITLLFDDILLLSSIPIQLLEQEAFTEFVQGLSDEEYIQWIRVFENYLNNQDNSVRVRYSLYLLELDEVDFERHLHFSRQYRAEQTNISTVLNYYIEEAPQTNQSSSTRVESYPNNNEH